MAAGLGDLVARLLLDAAPFRNEMQKQQGLITRFTSGLTSGIGSAVRSFAQLGLAVQGVNTVMRGLDRLVGTPLKLAAAAEQTAIAYRVMVGDIEKSQALIADVRKFAAETPFGMQESLAGGRQLLAFGFEPGEIADEMRMLGDIAAGVGAPLGDLVYLHGTLNAQGRAYAIDIRQLAMRGIPIYEALADTLGLSTDAVKELVSEGGVGFAEVQRALQSMTEEGGRFHGLSEEMLQSATGGWNKLQDAIQMAQIEVGTALFEELNLKQLIGDAEKVVEIFRRDMVPAIAEILKLATSFGSAFMEQFERIQNGIELFARAMTKIDFSDLIFNPQKVVDALVDAAEEMAKEEYEIQLVADMKLIRDLRGRIEDTLNSNPIEIRPRIAGEHDPFFKEMRDRMEGDEKLGKKLQAEADPERNLRDSLAQLQRLRERGIIDPKALMVGLEEVRGRFADALELTPGEEAEMFLRELKNFGDNLFGDPQVRAMLRSADLSQSLAKDSGKQLTEFDQFVVELTKARPALAGREDVQGLFDQFREQVAGGMPGADAFTVFRTQFESLLGGQDLRGEMQAAADKLQEEFFKGQKDVGNVRSLERGSQDAFEVLRDAMKPDEQIVNLQQQANEHLAQIAQNTAGGQTVQSPAGGYVGSDPIFNPMTGTIDVIPPGFVNPYVTEDEVDSRAGGIPHTLPVGIAPSDASVDAQIADINRSIAAAGGDDTFAGAFLNRIRAGGDLAGLGLGGIDLRRAEEEVGRITPLLDTDPVEAYRRASRFGQQVNDLPDPFGLDRKTTSADADDLRGRGADKMTRLLEQVAAAAQETAKNTKHQPPPTGQTVNVRVASDIV